MASGLRKRTSTNVRFFLLSDAVYYASYDLMNAFLAILITTKVTNDVSAVGLVIGYYLLLRASIELIFGKYLQEISNSRKILLVTYGHIFYGILIVLLGFSSTLIEIYLIQTFIAVIDAVTYPLKWSIFTKIIDKGQEEREWGLEDALTAITGAITAIIGGFIADSYGITILFVVLGVMYLVAGFTFKYIHIKRHKLKLF